MDGGKRERGSRGGKGGSKGGSKRAKAEDGAVTRFDLVALGEYEGESRYTRGAPKGKFPFAVSFTLADGDDVAALSDVGTEFLDKYEQTTYGRATTPTELNRLGSQPLPQVQHGFRSCMLCDALEYAQCQPNQGAFTDCEEMEHDDECPEDAAERTEPYLFPQREGG